MHRFCEKVWNQGYEARRKFDHMIADKHGVKSASDLFTEEWQKNRKRRGHMKKPVHRANRLGDALNELMEAEYIIAQLKRKEAFQALTARQMRQFHIVHDLLRVLIHDLEEDSAQEQMAS
jgi:hypothetical protein